MKGQQQCRLIKAQNQGLGWKVPKCTQNTVPKKKTQTWGPILKSEKPNSLTFQLADLRLTVRPLVVTVHFILMKKSLSALISLPFLSKPFPRAVKFDTVR